MLGKSQFSARFIRERVQVRFSIRYLIKYMIKYMIQSMQLAIAHVPVTVGACTCKVLTKVRDLVQVALTESCTCAFQGTCRKTLLVHAPLATYSVY